MLKAWGKVFTTLIWAFWYVCISQNSMLCTINIYNFVNSKINNWSFSQENGNCSDSLTITFGLVLKRNSKRKHSENVPNHGRGSFWLFNTEYDGLWFSVVAFIMFFIRLRKFPLPICWVYLYRAPCFCSFITQHPWRTCCIRQVNEAYTQG